MKQTWVIKIGSNVLTDGDIKLNIDLINNLIKQISELHKKNINVILVSSGAIAAGLGVVNLTNKPTDIHKLQALASIGQMDLMHVYEQSFSMLNITTAQILLTNEDLSNKDRYDNILGTINNLLAWGVVPIVNENDTVATDEIKFGDNDNLAALLSNLVDADKLIILTDQIGLFDKNPSRSKDAKLITSIAKNDKNIDIYASDEGGDLGTGGMKSKILAARVAKCQTHIASGKNPTVIMDIFTNKSNGSVLF